MSSLSDSQVQRLFSITTVEAVTSFLADIGATSGNGWKWVPLGGRDNNAGSVNLAVEAGQALVERITNEWMRISSSSTSWRIVLLPWTPHGWR